MDKLKVIRNIKSLIVFFSLLFLSLISYLIYFDMVKADKIAMDSTNKRVSIINNEVLRGSILSRDEKVIAYSKRKSDGTQERIYNDGGAFCFVTGYASSKYSKSGLELNYDDALQGSSFLYNIPGMKLDDMVNAFLGKEKKGYNIVTTIDYKTQLTAYKMMGKDKGSVVALDPKTGEILTMVSTPSFNPANIDSNFENLKNNDDKPLLNRAAQGYYPLGSIFKIITLTSALKNNPDIIGEKFNCTGKLNLGDKDLSCYGGKAHGILSLKDALKVSCNYTFGKIGMELGYDKLKETAEEFLFNKKIISNDSRDPYNLKGGTFSIEDKNSKALLAYDAIGQHQVASNPMHMALVASAIANNGTIMKPHIIKEIKNKNGYILEKTGNDALANALSPDTAGIIKDYMAEVVKSGTGTNLKINGIEAAAKTGSAEDGTENSHSWIVAFAPVDNPKIAVAVIVERGGLGGKRAAEVAREVIKAYLGK